MLQIDETGLKELRIKSDGHTIWIQPTEVLNLLEWFKQNKPYEFRMMILGNKKEPNDRDIASAALYECLRPQIRRMAHQMEQKFAIHDPARGDPFKHCDTNFLNTRLEDELDEFHRAMGWTNGYPRIYSYNKSSSEVWREAADVCNIITMLAVNYERTWDNNHKKKNL